VESAADNRRREQASRNTAKALRLHQRVRRCAKNSAARHAFSWRWSAETGIHRLAVRPGLSGGQAFARLGPAGGSESRNCLPDELVISIGPINHLNRQLPESVAQMTEAGRASSSTRSRVRSSIGHVRRQRDAAVARNGGFSAPTPVFPFLAHRRRPFLLWAGREPVRRNAYAPEWVSAP